MSSKSQLPTIVLPKADSPEFLPNARASAMEEAARAYQKVRRRGDGSTPTTLNLGLNSPPCNSAPAQLFRDAFLCDVEKADRLSRAVTSLPEIGCRFCGFHLIALLGKGAFGRVYLAEQGELASRRVVLKLSADVFGESQTLAQLQHTNIVPIYSIHRAEPFQAVCMPYFGATTLADVLAYLNATAPPPISGKLLVNAINDRKAAVGETGWKEPPHLPLLPPQDAQAESDQPPLLPSVSPPKVGGRYRGVAAPTLKKLESMSYVEAVLWIATGLADGLAHAHELGILHGDLKPANILLTDTGQPMLLDFNLSKDTKLSGSVAAASIGGTLPYLSPQQLSALCDKKKILDARNDIYSLGLIFYELLTGRLPFPNYPTVSRDILSRMMEDRRKPIPPIHPWNARVSPAVESIVRKCLEAEPAKRYQTARDLHEDLERQLHHLPLQHARDVSPRERLHKWIRRHPRLASTTSVAIMLGMFLLVLGTAFVARGRHLAHLEAKEVLGKFEEDMTTAQFLLYSRHADRQQLQDGINCCRSTLAYFHVLDNPQWRDLPGVLNLPTEDQQRLYDEVGELLFLLAKAGSLYAQYYSDPARRVEWLQEAQHFSLLAQSYFSEERSPKALWEQRCDLARLLGQESEARALAARAKEIAASSAKDYYLIAHKHAIQGNLRQALELLQKATQEDPRNFSAWFVRGNCYYDLLQDANAVACYNTCVALRPQFHWSWFNRGLTHLRLRNFRQAGEDFDRVIRLEPELAEAYINRARSKEGLQKYREAVEDYTRALTCPDVPTRVYFLRAEARARAGDQLGAQRDVDKGLASEPTDEQSWIARGLAKRHSDPPGALADFDRALHINPRSFEGLQNKAALLVDKFAKDAEALQVMEEAVKLYPDSVLARGGRGVLLARAGKTELARQDARASLLLDTSPSTLYQVACIYALTSRQNGNDRLEALHLLSSSLRAGFGLDFVGQDTDLDPLRSDPEFQRLVSAARALNTTVSGMASEQNDN